MWGQKKVRTLKRVHPGTTVVILNVEYKFDGTSADRYNAQVTRLEYDLDMTPDQIQISMWSEKNMRFDYIDTLVLVQAVEKE